MDPKARTKPENVVAAAPLGHRGDIYFLPVDTPIDPLLEKFPLNLKLEYIMHYSAQGNFLLATVT